MSNIYVVQSGSYSDRREHGYFLTQEEAINAAMRLIDDEDPKYVRLHDWMVLASPIGVVPCKTFVVWRDCTPFEEDGELV